MVKTPIKCIPYEMHRSVFLPWDGLCAAAAERIGAVIGRPVAIKVSVEECDWWAFALRNTKLRRCDMQMLFVAFEADKQDVEDNTMEPEVQATVWLSDGLSLKIVRDMIPVNTMAMYIATADGLWVIDGDTFEPPSNAIDMLLPNGQLLRASTNLEEDYPSLDIGIVHPGDEPVECLCFVEWNPDREGHELCVGAHTKDNEEPVYYESYIKQA